MDVLNKVNEFRKYRSGSFALYQKHLVAFKALQCVLLCYWGFWTKRRECFVKRSFGRIFRYHGSVTSWCLWPVLFCLRCAVINLTVLNQLTPQYVLMSFSPFLSLSLCYYRGSWLTNTEVPALGLLHLISCPHFPISESSFPSSVQTFTEIVEGRKTLSPCWILLPPRHRLWVQKALTSSLWFRCTDP